jgi:hypothetical protein
VLLAAITAGVLSACFPIKFEAEMNLPEPLIVKMPFTVALHVPPEFSSFVQKEKRWSVNWEVSLGKAQTEGFTQLLNAMFERVIVVDSIDAATRAGPVRAILEPTIEEYAFVTPRDAGSSFFAVSIKYRMGIYTPEGRLADSWAFTGYGSAPTAGMSDQESLQRATSLALRDAAAKLAVEFRDQEIVRELLPPPDASGAADGPSASESAAKQTASEGAATSESASASDNGSAPAAEAASSSDNGSSSESDSPSESGGAPTTRSEPPVEESPAPLQPQAPVSDPPVPSSDASPSSSAT